MNSFGNSTESKRRVAIYIRVSTVEQKIDGYGLEAQEKKLLDYVNQNTMLGLETKREWIYKDVHTGSDFMRPKLQELLADVKQGKFDAVLVWKIDRLSRSLKHLLSIFETFEKNQVSFVSVQENIDFRGAIGKLIFQIFGAIAQFERELIKGRTQMGRLTSAELGNYIGTHIPYGYKPVANPNGKGKKLEIIPKEKKQVEEIFNWYIYEELGDGQIAKRLNELRVPKGEHTKAKDMYSSWTAKVVSKIIENSLYRGECVANRKDENGGELLEKDWTVVSIPPCVSEFTFYQAQNARRSRVGGRRNTDYLLTGKLVDMTLETPKKFSGAKRHKGGFSYRRKQFQKAGNHYPVFEIAGKQMEDWVWEKIMKAMKNPEIFIKHYLSKKYSDPTRIQKIEDNLNNLRERKVNEEIAIGRIEEAFEKGTYSEEKLQEKTASKNKEIADIDQKIIKLEEELGILSSISVEVQKLKSASEQVKYRLDKLPHKQKKILCDLFVEKIEMRREKVGKKWKIQADVFFRFNPDKFSEPAEVGRTQKLDNKSATESKHPKKGFDGGRGRT